MEVFNSLLTCSCYLLSLLPLLCKINTSKLFHYSTTSRNPWKLHGRVINIVGPAWGLFSVCEKRKKEGGGGGGMRKRETLLVELNLRALNQVVRT